MLLIIKVYQPKVEENRTTLYLCGYATTTPWKGFTFCIYARVLHNVTPIDLLAQSAVLLRLPSFHKRVVTRAIGH